MTGNKWISINTTNVHRNTSEMILLLEKFLSYDNFILNMGWIYSHTVIVKSRVPCRDDLMNVKILFSCWPKYLYIHIWPRMRFRESKIFCITEDSEVPGQVNHYYYIHYTYTYIRLGIYNRVSKSITTQVNDGTRINFEFPEV